MLRMLSLISDGSRTRTRTRTLALASAPRLACARSCSVARPLLLHTICMLAQRRNLNDKRQDQETSHTNTKNGGYEWGDGMGAMAWRQSEWASKIKLQSGWGDGGVVDVTRVHAV